jgi:hypothetical protein
VLFGHGSSFRSEVVADQRKAPPVNPAMNLLRNAL